MVKALVHLPVRRDRELGLYTFVSFGIFNYLTQKRLSKDSIHFQLSMLTNKKNNAELVINLF